MKSTGRSSWKKVRVILILLLVVGIAIQFIRPRLDNPPVTADLQAPAEVKAILQRACYDCHSNETHLAWFDLPAPAYWLVADHVKDGRKVLNFSYIDSLPKGVQEGKLFESLNQIEYGVMPLSQYSAFHHGGRISKDEIAVLKRYLLTLTPKLVVDSVKNKVWLDQYGKWLKIVGPATVQNEYNGIPYRELADFSNWEAVSTTERYDNGTLRLILGNDITVRAIREGKTNPWPTGAVFAKVAWDQMLDSTGDIHPGVYKQVEFMIRDDSKYASTGGWGWARWVDGLNLKPYGHDASFTRECINCHKPMVPNDQTFTFPSADIVKFPGKVITTLVNSRSHTMSTLYGNDIAISSARSGQTYPAGAVVTLVTWSQKDDAHWFGGRRPDAAQSVEKINWSVVGPTYSGGVGEAQERINYISGLKASVLP